ncbi:hypothetical protein AB834_01680 [PVC group bacterium (ex Bugula neritina AB1)]|nr:hypothetical protein AB834_01680 [PVC group bacterium (ex Bugula neritina AB1)]
MGSETSSTKYFTLATFLLIPISIYFPSAFLWIKPYVQLGIAIIILGAGITLTFAEFKNVWHNKRLLFLALVLQYTIMPFLAYALSKIGHLGPTMMIGMILTGASPGGVTSNIMTLLCRGNLPLSISATFLSTLISPLVTPLIVFLTLHKTIEIELIPMMKTTCIMLLLPLFLGIVIKSIFKDRIKKVETGLPILSLVVTLLILGYIGASNRDLFLKGSFGILPFVALHNLLGLFLGYMVAKYFTKDRANQRTVALEVGMQNTALAMVLAIKFFNISAAFPAALFSLWHNIIGINLSRYWSSFIEKKSETSTRPVIND